MGSIFMTANFHQNSSIGLACNTTGRGEDEGRAQVVGRLCDRDEFDFQFDVNVSSSLSFPISASRPLGTLLLSQFSNNIMSRNTVNTH